MPERMVRMTSQDYQNYVGKRLYEFQQEDIMSDMMLRSSDGGFIPVHKCVAAATSLLVINAIKVHDQSNKAQLVLEMETVSTEILQKTVEFMYLGQVDVQDNKVAQLREAAELLQMENLTEACDRVLDRIRKKPTFTTVVPTTSGINTSSTSFHPAQLSMDVHEESDGDTEDEGEQAQAASLPKEHAEQESCLKLDCDSETALSQDNLGKIEAQLLGKASTDMEDKVVSECQYKCPFCPGVFENHTLIVKHIDSMHPGRLLNGSGGGSEVGSGVFNSVLKVVSTVSESSSSSTTSKQADNSSYYSGDAVVESTGCDKHDHEDDGNKLSCTYCSKEFRWNGNKVRHERLHTNIRPHECPYCDTSFVQKNQLDNHVAMHTGQRKYQCERCNKSFNLKGDLKAHQALHNEKGSFVDPLGNLLLQCSMCDLGFLSVRLREIHERHHFENKDRMYSCSQCEYVTSSLDEIRTHEKGCGTEMYQCAKCPRVFRSKTEFQLHEQWHSCMTKFTCTYCAKSFTTRQGLATHERIHRGEKPFSCRFCLQSFTQRHHVTQHERIHTGERPFPCRFCEKYFSLKANRDVHERIHTGQEKPYPCRFCARYFARKNKCADHELGCAKRQTVIGQPLGGDLVVDDASSNSLNLEYIYPPSSPTRLQTEEEMPAEVGEGARNDIPENINNTGPLSFHFQERNCPTGSTDNK